MASAKQQSLELTFSQFPTTAADQHSSLISANVGIRSSAENSFVNVTESPTSTAEPTFPTQTGDGATAWVKPHASHHKMSVPLVSPTSAAGRSRLSSFNLPLFNAGTKPMNFFSAHRRRGSLGKILQKYSYPKLTSSKSGNADDTVIDMEEQSKSEKADESAIVTDGHSELAPDSATIPKDTTTEDFGSSVYDGGSLMSPLDRAQSSTKKREREMSESSGARISFTDERQSKLSLANAGQRPPGNQRQRSCDHSAPNDAADLQRTERDLLSLLDDFNAGRLKAFGSSEASAALRGVREMQERLARSHFDVYALQEKIGFDNPKLASLSLSNWQALMAGMQELTDAVHRLGTASKVSQTTESRGSAEDVTLSNHDKADST